ncbi:MAG: hypothetical protein WCX33_01835 [Candidatus Shapirobacteria bacterium]
MEYQTKTEITKYNLLFLFVNDSLMLIPKSKKRLIKTKTTKKIVILLPFFTLFLFT